MNYYYFIDLQINNNFSYLEYLFIFVTSFCSNFFSAIAGGGAGLIQLPSLILFGLPYFKALASHKLATVALGLGGTCRNYKVIKKDLFIVLALLIFGIPGVLIGTVLVNFLSEDYLYFLLSIFSIFIGGYSYIKPDFGLKKIKKNITVRRKFIFVIFVFIIGILNGSISSGTGLLITILLVKTFGMDFLSAISLTFLTVGIFWNAAGGIALSKIGGLPKDILIILIAGSFSGGYLGAHLSNLKGNKLIKNFFTLICFAIGISLFIKGWRTFFI